MGLFSILGALFLSSLGIYPASPTVLVFRSRDFGGKSREGVVVKSFGGKLRLEGFHQTFVFDGKQWFSDGDPSEEADGAVAFMAPLTPQGDVRTDSLGRPILLEDVPVGKKKARIEYRYDSSGLSAVNFVLSDGSGYQFRRVEISAATFNPADFERPKEIEPEPSGKRVVGKARAPDFAAVDRLFSIVIAPSEQLEFERAGSVGPFQSSRR
ncbi:MAG: hypothetical protein ACRD16_12250 [Thermoanaerobaculia bacterium]